MEYLNSTPDESFRLIYIDPPFNTGKDQVKTTQSLVESTEGTHIGYQGKSYASTVEGVMRYADTFSDYLSFLRPRLEEAHRLLTEDGTLYVHLDWREVHYVKVMMDEIFGRDNFLNEIIWAYDYGAKSKKKWPTKHDTILVYVKNAKSYYYSSEDVDREPYMAPGLVTEEKRERGKLPTDVWWHTIVATNGKEKTGYPTQKPVGVLKRIVTASSKPGDTVLDFFAGSGTTGAAALELDRNFVLVDSHLESIEVMKKRFSGVDFQLIE